MSLAPTNEESAWTGKKTSVRKKTSLSGSVIACVDSFSITNNKRKSYMERRDSILFYSYSKNGVTRLMFNLSDLLPRSTLIVPFV